MPRGGILYIEDFDAPEDSSVPECVPEEPVYGAADVAVARAEAWELGAVAARAEAASVREELRHAALLSLADAVRQARDQLTQVAERTAFEIGATVLAMLRAALPATAARCAEAELGPILQNLLPGLRAEPELLVRVHPDITDWMQAQLTEGLVDHPVQWRVVGTPTMARGDLSIAWAEGKAIRDHAKIWDGVRAALAPLDLPTLKDIIDGS